MASQPVSMASWELFVAHARDALPTPSIEERIRFAIVLGQLRLGAIDQGGLAARIGARRDQLSKWVGAKRNPSPESIKALAEAVGIDWLWLSDPKDPRAKEPVEFPQWWARRVEDVLAEDAPLVRPQMPVEDFERAETSRSAAAKKAAAKKRRA
jgi:transcriptional regulator with XRE-family HTH domain